MNRKIFIIVFVLILFGFTSKVQAIFYAPILDINVHQHSVGGDGTFNFHVEFISPFDPTIYPQEDFSIDTIDGLGSYTTSGFGGDYTRFYLTQIQNTGWQSPVIVCTSSNPLITTSPITNGILIIGQPFSSIDCDITNTKATPESPDTYYTKITNIPGDVAELYDTPSRSGTLIKTLPNDWIVKVVGKLGTDNKPMISGGYLWYQVEDPTDNTIHYMIAGTGSDVIYLPYQESKQIEYENNSVNNLSGNVNSSNRRDIFLQALDHYYNNESSTKSLYSGNDTTLLSSLKNGSFPKEVILAMVAQEISGEKFDNENVSFDYGHGLMQVTMDALAHENPTSKKYGFNFNIDDPRGFSSRSKVEVCKEENSDQYKKCYENTDTYNTKKKPYSHYDHNNLNPIYKQYANTIQSVYANIKDGLGILLKKYKIAVRNSCEGGSYTVEGYTFNCNDLVNVKTVWFYNGKSFSTKYNYMKDISNQLKVLSNTFPGITYANNDNLIEKLAIANRHRIEIDAHSPIEVRVKDSLGHIIGLVNGEDIIDIPNGTYNKDTESAVIFFPTDTYKYEVVGDSTIPTGGTYGLDINIFNGSDTPLVFNAVNLPITEGEKHIYTVDQTKLAQNAPDAVTIQIDTNGDGTIDRTVQTNNELSSITPYDFKFIKPSNDDDNKYKINKELSVSIKVTADHKKKIPLQHPWLKITRILDRYSPITNIVATTVNNDCHSDKEERNKEKDKKDKKDDNCSNSSNIYVFQLPKNILTKGQWNVEVGLDNVVKHSININMVK